MDAACVERLALRRMEAVIRKSTKEAIAETVTAAVVFPSRTSPAQPG